jgi:hypothetical protein
VCSSERAPAGAAFSVRRTAWCHLVSGNVAGSDILLRFRPDVQVLLYRV